MSDRFTTAVPSRPFNCGRVVVGRGSRGASRHRSVRRREAVDVIVYGGTAGGVITAVAAAREGLRVTLVTPDRHLGGMMSGGLGWTDYGKKQVIGGYSLEVFERVGQKYGRPDRVALRAPCRGGGLRRDRQGGGRHGRARPLA